MNVRAGLTLLGAAAFTTALAVFITWPQALHLGTAVVSHQDPYFSAWRVAWIAHALVTSPAHLFDTNVFYPSTGTLVYSDAMLLEGLVGAPLLWAHVSPVTVHNVLLFIGFAGSGLAMFVLARALTGATGPALVAAAVFTLAPYRTEHMMHLELQWAMWIPLTFWAFHRAVETSSARHGVLAGLFVWLQIISCIYYGVFLALTLAVFVPVLLLTAPRKAFAAAPAIVLSAIVAVVLTLPYLWPYVQAARALGSRDLSEVAHYSARPLNYLSTSYLNWLWGWTADRWGGPELRLYPGIVAVLLAIAAVFNRSKRWVLLYALVAIVAVEMSLGLNSRAYRWLMDHVTPLGGLRSPSRFAIVGSCALAMLAALGTQALLERRGRSPVGSVLLPVLLALLLVDYANRPLALTPVDWGTTAPVYKVILSAGPGVIAEFPAPTPDRLPGADPYYSAWSISHWQPLLNGYSGYHPPDYLRTLERLRSFPDDASIARLRERHVRYVVIHEALYEREPYTKLMLQLAARPELKAWGRYKDPVGTADLFTLEH